MIAFVAFRFIYNVTHSREWGCVNHNMVIFINEIRRFKWNPNNWLAGLWRIYIKCNKYCTKNKEFACILYSLLFAEICFLCLSPMKVVSLIGFASLVFCVEVLLLLYCFYTVWHISFVSKTQNCTTKGGCIVQKYSKVYQIHSASIGSLQSPVQNQSVYYSIYWMGRFGKASHTVLCSICAAKYAEKGSQVVYCTSIFYYTCIFILGIV